jgi:lipopolysaccharide transport system permease protein
MSDATGPIEVVYSAESPLTRPFALLRETAQDLWLSRELAWRLFRRDLGAQYRRSYFGYAWIVAPPLVNTLIWVFLSSQQILQVGDTGAPYPLFVLTGILLWETFVSALQAPLTAVSGAIPLITKLNFPREALLLAALGQALVNAGVRLALLACAFLWFGVAPQAGWLLAPVVVLGLIVLGFAIGQTLLPASLLYHDISRALSASTAIWFFLTPIVYPPPAAWPARLVNWVNPVSPLLCAARELCLGQPLTQPQAVLATLLASGLLFGLSWLLFRITLPEVVARIS